MKKKILFINGHLNAGGVEKVLIDILRNIDLSKYDVDLLLLEGLGDYEKDLPSGIHVRLMDLHNTYGNIISSLMRCIKLRDWKCFWIRIVFFIMKYLGVEKLRWASKAIVGDKKYDCVVGFRPGISLELAVYSVNAKRRIGWWHHGEIDLNPDQAENFAKAGERIDQLVSVSNGCKDMLEKNFPSLQGKMIVIPNMLDLEVIREKAVSYVPFEKLEGITDFVTVGRLSPEKHVENAVFAAEILRKQGFETFRWYLIGDGAERDRLQKLISEKKLDNQVFLEGSRENPYPYMKQSDYLIHTSYVESYCLVVLEAMALNTPCVVTESVGPREFCVDERNCIWVQQSVESLVAGINRARSADTDEIINEAGQLAENVDAHKVIQRVEKVIDGV